MLRLVQDEMHTWAHTTDSKPDLQRDPPPPSQRTCWLGRCICVLHTLQDRPDVRQRFQLLLFALQVREVLCKEVSSIN
jgi:hypothetical protein